MSASREKKQRQGAGPSEKALQAQQQQAARRQKTVAYTVTGVVIAVLVAALLIWYTGFFQARATAATVGGRDLSAAELSYYYYGTRSTYLSYMSYFGNVDTSIPDDQQPYAYGENENTTLRDYFMEEALKAAQQSAALADEARKNGHTEAEVKDGVDAQIQNLKASAAAYGSSYSSYLKAIYGSYMSAGVYEKLYTQDLLGNLAYNDKGAELSDGYSEADLRAYYEADDHADGLDTFEYSYLYFTPAMVSEEDADGNPIDEDTVNEQKEAALAEAKEKAEEALQSVKDGKGITSLSVQYDLIDANFGDHVSIVGSSNAAYAIQEKLLSMKEGDVELAENGEAGYYVVALHSRKLADAPTKDVRHILIRPETATDSNGNAVAPTDEAWAAAREKIEAIQAEYEAGDRTEDSFAALANEKSEDGDGTTGGLYTKIDVNDGFVPEFLEWIFADGRSAGDTGIIQHIAGDDDGNKYWGYHFMYMVGDNEPLWMRTVREDLTSEDLSAWMEELRGNYETSLAGGANGIGR